MQLNARPCCLIFVISYHNYRYIIIYCPTLWLSLGYMMIHDDRPTIPGSWDVSGSVNFSPHWGLYMSTRYQDLAVRHPREIACLPSTQSRLDRAGLVVWRNCPNGTIGNAVTDAVTGWALSFQRMWTNWWSHSRDNLSPPTSGRECSDFSGTRMASNYRLPRWDMFRRRPCYCPPDDYPLTLWDLMKSHRFSIVWPCTDSVSFASPLPSGPMSHALGEVPGALDAGQGGGREVLTGTLKNFGISESKSHFGEANGLSEHEETKGFGITKLLSARIPSCFHAPLLTGALPRHEKYLSHVETRVQRWVWRDRQRDPEEHPRDSERCLGEYPACWRELRWQGRPQGGRNPWNKSHRSFWRRRKAPHLPDRGQHPWNFEVWSVHTGKQMTDCEDLPSRKSRMAISRRSWCLNRSKGTPVPTLDACLQFNFGVSPRHIKRRFLLYQNTAPSQGAVEVIIPDKPILSLIHSQHQPARRRRGVNSEGTPLGWVVQFLWRPYLDWGEGCCRS